MKMIDLRSDTVTLPTPEMLEAIAQAGLGDDVYGEDPTVIELQELAARTFGAEDALLATSGTQGNLLALMSWCRPGDEVLLESKAHIYSCEAGNMAAVAGALPRLISGERGAFTGEQVRQAVRGKDLHFPTSGLLALENTHSRAGGTCWTPAQVSEAAEAAHDLGMKVHIDGSRIFNASVALGVPVADYSEARRLHPVLPVQGIELPGGVSAGRHQKVHRGGSQEAKNDRWGDEAGGHHRCPGHHRPK